MAESPKDTQSPEVLSALGRMERILAIVKNVEDVPPPPPRDPLRGDPYSVERFPSVRGGVVLVGYDGRGDVMLEFRIPEHMYSKRLVAKMQRFLREYDTGPNIRMMT